MSKRIMVVDDSRLVRVQLGDVLEGTDYEIVEPYLQNLIQKYLFCPRKCGSVWIKSVLLSHSLTSYLQSSYAKVAHQILFGTFPLQSAH